MLDQAGFAPDDVDWLVPHQANKRIIDAVGKRLQLPADKVVVTVERHANTSAASIPLALERGRRGRPHPARAISWSPTPWAAASPGAPAAIRW